MAAPAAQIEATLPQTQCGRCGFAGCKPYAQAISDGIALINRCPPGGAATVVALAALLGIDPPALDPSCGPPETSPRVARVVEPDCIGCARCLDACPVDAIVGARQRMHTVIDAECTGCELCLPACPVDCIVLEPRKTDALLARERAAHSRARVDARLARLAHDQARRHDRRGSRASVGQVSVQDLLAAAARPRKPTGAP